MHRDASLYRGPGSVFGTKDPLIAVRGATAGEFNNIDGNEDTALDHDALFSNMTGSNWVVQPMASPPGSTITLPISWVVDSDSRKVAHGHSISVQSPFQKTLTQLPGDARGSRVAGAPLIKQRLSECMFCAGVNKDLSTDPRRIGGLRECQGRICSGRAAGDPTSTTTR